MAEYFVSVQTGNDVNDGLSSEHAWATITKAVGIVAAGDIVRIAPGVYRERPQLVTAGTSEAWIQWLPDPDCARFPNVKPGIVRVTGRDVNEIGANLTVWNFNAKPYNRLGERDKWGQIYIDGALSSAYAVVIGDYGGNNTIEINGAQIIGKGVNATSTEVDLRMSASIVVGAGNGHSVYGGHNCYSVIAIPGFYFTKGVAVNCIGIGPGLNATFYSFPAQAARAENCLAIASDVGFREVVTYNCIAMACAYSGIITTGGEVKTFASLSENTFLQLNLLPLIQAFRPLYSLHADSGDNTYGNATYDIAGHVRKLGSGTIGFGPYETSVVSVDHQNYYIAPPAIKIERTGMQKFVFHATSGEEFTKAVWVKWTGTTKPQLIVDGDHITRTTITALGDGSSWEQLTISATPDADGEIELYLYARDTGVSSVAYFSGLE